MQAAIHAEPENKDNWIMLGLYAVMAGLHGQCRPLFEKREELFGDGAALYFSTLVSNIVADSPHLLAQVAAIPVPDIRDMFDAVTVFGVGAARTCLGPVEQGRAILRRLNDMPDKIRCQLDRLPQVQRSGRIIEMFFSPSEIEAMRAEAAPAWDPDISSVSGKRPVLSGPLHIFTLADQSYFERFGEGFIQAVGGIAPVHIHVMDGDETKIEAVLARFGERVTATVEPFEGENLAPYCASSRFLHVQRLLKAGTADILCMDIDVAEVNDFDRYLHRARTDKISLFQDSTTVPWLRQWATSIYFGQSKEAELYLEVLCHLIRHHLSDMAWFFDQTALLSMWHWAREQIGEDVVSLMNEPDGYRLHDFITPSGALAEKIALRRGTGLEGV
ncbi:hypothetical protein [Aestuariispira insulae]|uniref:hypothetical protein n=1 Tax=Aestuariispira insulae TaxID=1461337 RepID=UPI000E285634|nr:hypothetical protein [Aestuariispira insulae]